LSFEPFVIECWAGGQLSAIGFATLALAIWSVRRGRDALAGAALGFCLYKPTLLVLLLPMLLVGRRWKTLAAFAGVSLFLALVSFVAAGRQACADYLGVLREYVNATAHGAAIFPKWKFVNVSAWMGWKLMLLVSSPALALLTRAWCKRDGDAALLWACTLVWTLVVNLHVGIYDVVLAIPCVLLLAERRLWRELKWTIALLYVTPWFSQQLARATGVQMLSLVLAGLGVIALREIALAGVRGFSLESHQ
jgi:hypothetical protein